jgi:hypothetical protein
VIAQFENKATFSRITWVTWSYPVLAPLSQCYPELEGGLSMYYSPVRRSTSPPKGSFALDLHVLGTPPAFVLSQDQTLN